MLDINKIRNETSAVETALLKRLDKKDFDLGYIITLDDKRRALIAQADALKAERNKQSKTKPAPDIIAKMKKLGEKIAQLDNKHQELEKELADKLSGLPNLPAKDVVAGDKESNKVLQTFGKKPEFKFTPQDHMALVESLGIVDYECGAKIAGAGFWVYRGAGAALEWALLNYFIDFHHKYAYTFIIPPFLLSEESAYTSGHLPKFRDDLYWIQDGLCLNATSEMMLLNLHRDEILPASELPKKYFAYSTCFRREAGSYRTEERGMVRGHQFNKIEMFQFTRPDASEPAFDELLDHATRLADGLGMHFQTVRLAAQDISAAMAKTVDLEVFIPSMNIYKEISSVSNATDYQARRGNIRFKDPKTGRNDFVHTLNASGLATSRLVPAILEQFQQKDGSVLIPKALHKYCGFEKIVPRNQKS